MARGALGVCGVAAIAAACGSAVPIPSTVSNRSEPPTSLEALDVCPKLVFHTTADDDDPFDEHDTIFADPQRSFVPAVRAYLAACGANDCWDVVELPGGSMTSNVFVSPSCLSAAYLTDSDDEDHASTLHFIDLRAREVRSAPSHQMMNRIPDATWNGERLTLESYGHTGVGWVEVWGRSAQLIHRELVDGRR